MTDNYIYIIIALLPLASLMSVLQVNPYNALVIRAILGAVAALVYAVLGAGDVALTEALVGTMLAVTLYVVAVRSSLVMRLGIVKTKFPSDIELEFPSEGTGKHHKEEINDPLSFLKTTGKHHKEEIDDSLGFLKTTVKHHKEEIDDPLSFLKTTPFKDVETEQDSYWAELIPNLRKIIQKHHLRLDLVEYPNSQALEQALMAKEVHAICTKQEQSDRILVRVHRLFEIMQTELTLPGTILKYVTVSNTEEKH